MERQIILYILTFFYLIMGTVYLHIRYKHRCKFAITYCILAIIAILMCFGCQDNDRNLKGVVWSSPVNLEEAGDIPSNPRLGRRQVKKLIQFAKLRDFRAFKRWIRTYDRYWPYPHNLLCYKGYDGFLEWILHWRPGSQWAMMDGGIWRVDYLTIEMNLAYMIYPDGCESLPDRITGVERADK